MTRLPLRTRIIFAGAWVVNGMAFAGLITVLAWLLWPYQGLTMRTPKFSVHQQVVPAGTALTYDVAYCVSGVPVPINVNRELELISDEGMVFPIAPPYSYLITKLCETRVLVVGIPTYLPAGSYRINTRTELHVNPLRLVRQVFESELFEVTK